MKEPSHTFTTAHMFLVIALLILTGGVGYLVYAQVTTTAALNARIDRTSKDLYTLTLNVASTTQILQHNIAETHSDLADSLNRQQQSLQSQLGSYQQQVNSVAGTVTTLQKLAKTDPELLQKYSKVYFLNENYAPSELYTIPNQYKYSDAKPNLIATPVWPFMQKMLDAATAANIKLYVYSSYRSFKEQSNLKTDYKVTYGAGTANTFSADQGYSEHQLGTTADFITGGLGGQLDGFDQTAAFKWMTENAWKYGFILSYPDGNSYYEYEPWHWRFVGVKLATDLHNNRQNFNDLDQRTLDAYLVNIFDSN